MNENYELTWKRSPETGHWLASDNRDGAAYYVAARDTTAQPGRQWTLTVAVPGRPGTQARSGFSTLATAKAAALATRCHLCGRHLPFAAMEQSGSTRSGGWRCRDREECAAIETARDAEIRRITAEIRNTPWAESGIRDTDAGPELVIGVDNGPRYVIPAIEADLFQLSYVLLTWLRTRYADELAKITEARKAARS